MKTLTLSTKILIAVFALAAVGAASVVAAATNWELQTPSDIDFTCGGGIYSHSLDTLTQDLDGDLTGTGYYIPNNGITWDLTGNITGDDITFTVVYTGINPGYTLNLVGTIASDGSISGTSDGNCQTFAMPAGSAEFLRSAEITAPGDGEIVYGVVPFAATLIDKDSNDAVQWAVRAGTCAAGTNTVFGNVDGFSSDYDWDGADFYSEADTSGWTNGDYCFIFNPKESSGDTPIRETQEFVVSNPPTDANQCKKGGWEDFLNPTFDNQGMCVSYVQSNENAGIRSGDNPRGRK